MLAVKRNFSLYFSRELSNIYLRMELELHAVEPNEKLSNVTE